jgi:acyl-CoA thioesterase-2
VQDADAVAEMLELLTVRPGDEEGTWTGAMPDWFGDYVFGGFIVGQAIAAATRHAPEGARLHSMHAYFLRPVRSAPVDYRVRPIRDGRAFASRHLDATQEGKPVVTMMCSFTADTDGYVYDLPRSPDVPPPDQLEQGEGPGPWEAAYLGPTELRPDGTYASTHRAWFRIPARLPDDVHVHTALIGYATDWTGIGGRPLHLEGDITGMVSLDHSAWFHRPARADEWLYYDVTSLVNAGGRGLLQGVMRDLEGRIVASLSQEMRLTVIEG